MTDGKAVNYNGREIIGLIHLKYGKRTACRDNFFLPRMQYFPEKQGKGRQRGINPNLTYTSLCYLQNIHIFQYVTQNSTFTRQITLYFIILVLTTR